MRDWKERPKSIFRTIKRNNPYVQIDGRIYEDPNLSIDHLGLLSALLAKPDDWIISLKYLMKRFTRGKAYIGRVVNDLLRFGYMLRIPHRHSTGEVDYYEYLVFERPDLLLHFVKTHPAIKFDKRSLELISEIQKAVDQAQKTDSTIKKTSLKLVSEKQQTAKQEPVNQPQLKNDLELETDLELKIDRTNPPSYSPPKQQTREGEIFDLTQRELIESVARMIWGEYGQKQLEELTTRLADFPFDPEILSEARDSFDASQVKSSPMGYFITVSYPTAMAKINKRRLAKIEAEEMARYIEAKEQMRLQGITPSVPEQDDFPERRPPPADAIASIRTTLGIK